MLDHIANHYKRFRRFSFVGLVNTGIDFAIFSLLFYAYGTPYVVAHVLAFFVALANSFLMNALWTFKNLKREQLVRQIGAFVLVGAGGLVLSTITIYILAGYMPVLLAKIGAMGVSLIWNYVGSWIFVFRK